MGVLGPLMLATFKAGPGKERESKAYGRAQVLLDPREHFPQLRNRTLDPGVMIKE